MILDVALGIVLGVILLGVLYVVLCVISLPFQILGGILDSGGSPITSWERPPHR